jgi:hypothetical protein
MNYIYRMNYDALIDDFIAIVDDGTIRGEIIFEIDDIDEIKFYIRTGVMKHIDDVDGLENYLKSKQIIEVDDSLLLCERMI